MNLRRSFTTTATALVLLAALVAGGSSQAAAAVVCIGSDGHVGLERPLDPCCTTITVVASTAAENALVADPGCAGCTDVSVDAPQLRCRAPEPSPPVILPMGISAVAGSTAPADDRDHGPAGADQRGHDVEALAAVVLLT